MNHRARRAARIAAASITAVVLLAACGGGGSEAPSAAATAAQSNLPPFNFEIRTLSNRADLISGGDALVEVRVPKQVSLSAVKVKLNGHDITSSFKTNAAARTLRGLVTGLADGRNDLVAEADSKGKGKDKDDGKEVRLTITNHPIGGPVLLGSQTQPWICATPTPVAQSGNTPASIHSRCF